MKVLIKSRITDKLKCFEVTKAEVVSEVPCVPKKTYKGSALYIQGVDKKTWAYILGEENILNNIVINMCQCTYTDLSAYGELTVTDADYKDLSGLKNTCERNAYIHSIINTLPSRRPKPSFCK